MKLHFKFLILLVISAILASSAFFFFPAVKEGGAELIVAIAFSSSIVQFLAVFYFLTGLKTFKPGLRVAYYWLAAGIFLFSLVLAVPSLSVFTDIIARDSTISSLAIILPYILSALFMYIAMNQFARLLGVRSIWSNMIVGLAIAVGAAGFFWFLPHPNYDPTDWVTTLIFASAVWCGTLGLAAFLLSLRIHRSIGELYKKSMFWITIALGSLAVTALHEVIVKDYFINTDYAINQYSLLPLLITGILFLRAGLAIREAGVDTLVLPANASPVDIVVSASQLVSKPAEVDKELDKIRVLTTTSDIKDLSAEDKKTLLGVYLYIENYLVTQEPLHTFTREGIRNGLPEYFLKDLKSA